MTAVGTLRILREQWLTILSFTLAGVALAAGVFLVRPAEYSASVSLYVSAQNGDDPQQAYQGAQLSEQRVKSYTELVTSDRVLQQTIDSLRLDETPKELAPKVVVTNALDSVLINIQVTDVNPERAALIADTVSRLTSGLVDELERPTAPGAIQPVTLRVVQPARVPSTPSSSSLATTLAAGLLAGLILGGAAAALRNTLDTSIKGPDDVNLASGSPNLGRIAFDPRIRETPLAVHHLPQSSVAESFRALRTNLQFIDIDKAQKVIAVTSATPGEGKSTTVSNLGLSIAAAGGRVLLIEGDLRKPELSRIFGIDRSVGLTSVLTGRVAIPGAVQSWGGGSLDILSSGPVPPNPSELLSSSHMRALVEGLRKSYDVVIIDTPPVLPVTDAAAIAPILDGVLMVCRHSVTTRAQVQNAVEAIRVASGVVLGNVLTMTTKSAKSTYGTYGNYGEADTSSPANTPKYTNSELNNTPPPTSRDEARAASRAQPSDKSADTHRLRQRPPKAR